MDPRPKLRMVTLIWIHLMVSDPYNFEGMLSLVSRHNYRTNRMPCLHV